MTTAPEPIKILCVFYSSNLLEYILFYTNLYKKQNTDWHSIHFTKTTKFSIIFPLAIQYNTMKCNVIQSLQNIPFFYFNCESRGEIEKVGTNRLAE